VIHVSHDQVEKWREHAGIVSALSRDGGQVFNLSAWCEVDFYAENPVSEGHPAYDEITSVMEDEDRQSWCLVDEAALDTSVESVRSDTNHVEVRSQDLVWCGQSKYGNDRYESAWVNINALYAAVAAKA
jgi:hypothetical protein